MYADVCMFLDVYEYICMCMYACRCVYVLVCIGIVVLCLRIQVLVNVCTGMHSYVCAECPYSCVCDFGCVYERTGMFSCTCERLSLRVHADMFACVYMSACMCMSVCT